MTARSPEQLDWLKKKDDDDERFRLENYGIEARNAPLSEEERKKARKKKVAEENEEYQKLLKKLQSSPAPNIDKK